jgi:DNA-binding transcriptional LysR family regulator
MQMQQLRYFLAVVEQGGFTRAAQQLGRTQQAVSKALRLLEQDLGVRLLDREAGGPRPTAFGLMLLEFARRVTRDEGEFRARLQQVRSAARGQVRIGASVTVAGSLVTPATEQLLAAHRGIAVSVVDGIQPTLVPALARGELDLAVFIRTLDEPLDAALTVETLSQQDYRIVAGAGHPLASAAAAPTVPQLAVAAWVLGTNSGDIELAWREAFESAGYPPPQPELVTSSVEFCREVLRRDRHLSVLPTGLIAGDLETGRLVALAATPFGWQRPVNLVYRSDAVREPAVLATIRALHEVAETGAHPARGNAPGAMPGPAPAAPGGRWPQTQAAPSPAAAPGSRPAATRGRRNG